ncbi:MAG: tRNA dimethylallyltransferase 2 [Gemmatimonadota bacterium]|nr:MAG: tRNA dimethylallyltransferase 2 [Gemmatimonadota bacterium]
MSRPFDLLCVIGPTATGKTRLAVALARSLGGEVLSADSRQVYRGMDIGTGKDRSEYGDGESAVPAHLLDLVDAGQEFHLFDFQRAFRAAYEDVSRRKALPILCGGSGLYVDAIVNAYRLVEAPPDPVLREELADESDDELVQRLADLRPLHNTTDTRDRERLIRAIEIAQKTRDTEGEPPEFPPLRSRVYGLRADRSTLRSRIADRLAARLAAGLVDEVRGLRNAGLSADRLDRYGLEYRFVTRHLEGVLTLDEMTRQLESQIYRFAKRQVTWFRRMERQGTRIHWINAETPLREMVAGVLQSLPE